MIKEFLSQREKEKYFRSLSEEQKAAALNEIVERSEHIVFLGGAGVSTESGIPDFRSKNGLYHKKDRRFARYQPEYLLSSDCLYRKPEVFFDYFRRNLDCRAVEPNTAHYKLAGMEQKGRLDGIITQNIDGLHQKAGSRNVQEIHGSALRSHCVSCWTEYGADFIFESKDPIPVCPACGKMIRPEVTLYGEVLPDEAYGNAIHLIQDADCLIIGGTSLVVYPAAGLVNYYRGNKLVLINKSSTSIDSSADLVIADAIGEVFSQIKVNA